MDADWVGDRVSDGRVRVKGLVGVLVFNESPSSLHRSSTVHTATTCRI
jgi:hypothetical protein